MPSPLVVIDDLAFHYGDPAGGAAPPFALQGITLTIGRGEIVAVIGHNGSGKSTLARHLNGLLRPTAGRVLVAGHDTRRTSVARLAAHVGYAFQNPDHQLFAPTVAADVAFGPRNLGVSPAETERRVADALAALDLEAVAERHPLLLGHGTRRLVALAGVLALDPALLVLDEPTAGLDRLAAARVLDLVDAGRQRGVSSLLITHDFALVARHATRVLLLRDGRLLADGSARALITDETLLATAGLAPPVIVRLSHALAPIGVRPDPLTVAELSESYVTGRRSEVGGRRNEDDGGADQKSEVRSQESDDDGWSAGNRQPPTPESRVPTPAPSPPTSDPRPPTFTRSVAFDVYHAGKSWLHRLDPRVKLLAVAVAAVGLVLADGLGTMAVTIIAVHLLLLAAAVPVRRLLGIWRAIAPLLLLIIALWPIFDREGTTVLVEAGWVRVTAEALLRGLAAAGRVAALSFVIFVWLVTTAERAMIRGFVRLGVPRRWGVALAIGLRSIPALAELYSAVSAAQQARGLRLDGSPLARVRARLPMLVATLVTALRLADQTARALDARAFGARPNPTALHDLRMRPVDRLALTAVLLGAILVVVVRFVPW